MAASRLPEIVAPAGNLEKLKMAVRFGADAVYFGGGGFNLRAQADNFTPDEIAKAVEFCAGHGARTVFLVNSFLHEAEIPAAREYIASIQRFPFDAVMVSDPGMLLLLRECGVTAAVHLSTQMSTLNHLAIRFWRGAGVSRIVLARETSLEEIRMIRDHCDAEIEVFVHGALCISYSGRCLLSRYLSGRDANRGDCSHPCRWHYTLVEEKRPGSHLEIAQYNPVASPGGRSVAGTEILSSKDLCLIGRIPDYVSAGVTAFKIEGRMKSLYYAAGTARVYRDAVRLAGTDEFTRRLPFWKEELDLVSHRPYTEDLFNEFGSGGFRDLPMVQKALFLGYAVSAGNGRTAGVKAFNPIRRGETVECIYPIEGDIRDATLHVERIVDGDGLDREMARPGETCRITFDRDVLAHGIFRRRLVDGTDR
ncbi:MAG: U32 family peptidase [Spirochaetes bacterium]|nr:U32 family peptidase [Spirochaetota bacterium]